MLDIHRLEDGERSELPRLVAIVGPTGVGKTELSLRLASALGAEIVNLDSVQVYRELDIGSAKPSPDDRERVPHHLIDLLEPNADHNVGDYMMRAREVISALHTKGKHAIVVGGTGLYLRALIHGLMDAPAPDASIRARHKADAKTYGVHTLHQELKKVDPVLAARLHQNDLVRISRGLEIFEQTGKQMSALQAEHQFRTPNYEAFKLALVRPRAELYERINTRVDAMMDAGFLEECRRLYACYGHEIKSLQSLGYRQMATHLVHHGDLEHAVDSMKQQTRRYAKQQLGWLRSEPDVHWVRAPVVQHEVLFDEIVCDLERYLQGVDVIPSWANADSYM